MNKPTESARDANAEYVARVATDARAWTAYVADAAADAAWNAYVAAAAADAARATGAADAAADAAANAAWDAWNAAADAWNAYLAARCDLSDARAAIRTAAVKNS